MAQPQPRSQPLVQFLTLPLTAAVYGARAMLQTAQLIQTATLQGFAALFGGFDPDLSLPADPPGSVRINVPPTAGETGYAVTTAKEMEMSDRDLSSDDKIYVVEYSILTVRPDMERILYGPKLKIVTEAMKGEDFVSWVVADYFQEHPHDLRPEHKKWVRVCWFVQCWFDKEDANYSRDQVVALHEINATLERGFGLKYPRSGEAVEEAAP